MLSLPVRALLRRAASRSRVTAVASGAGLALLAGSSLATPGSEPFIPELTEQAKPGPPPILPIYDLARPGGLMPYNRPQAAPELGAIDGVLGAMRPARVGGSYSSITGGQQYFGDLRVKQPKFMVKAIAAVDTGSDDYADADGDDQRFGYERQSGQFVLGWTPDADRTLRLVGVGDSLEDYKTPLARPTNYGGPTGVTVLKGFGADPVNTDRAIARLGFDDKTRYGPIGNLRVELYDVDAERQANNFKLRETPRSNWARNDVEFGKRGGSLAWDIDLSGQVIDLGVTYTTMDRTGRRFGGPTTGLSAPVQPGAGQPRSARPGANQPAMGQANGGPSGVQAGGQPGMGGGAQPGMGAAGGMPPSDLSRISSYQFPGAEVESWKVDATTTFAVAEAHDLTLGLRWEQTDGTASKVDLPTYTPAAGFATSRDLYETYYGDVAIDRTEGHWSGKLQWDFAPDALPIESFLSFGLIRRAPNLHERYFALQSFFAGNHPNAGSAQGTSLRSVGNPEIDWELHRRLEGGIVYSADGWTEYGVKTGTALPWRLALTAHYDDVKDFITRDRARGQTVTGVFDYARIRRNVDAELAGVEADLKANLTRRLATRLNVQYQYGHNTSDDRALYGIYPTELNWFLDYRGFLGSGGSWSIGSRLRHVAALNDADDDPRFGSGFDAGNTDSYTTFDLYGAIQWNDRVGLRLGVDNLFNEQYAEPHALDVMEEGSPYLVNAPGRSATLALIANF